MVSDLAGKRLHVRLFSRARTGFCFCFLRLLGLDLGLGLGLGLGYAGGNPINPIGSMQSPAWVLTGWRKV
jgi:hypothetical protein